MQAHSKQASWADCLSVSGGGRRAGGGAWKVAHLVVHHHVYATPHGVVHKATHVQGLVHNALRTGRQRQASGWNPS